MILEIETNNYNYKHENNLPLALTNLYNCMNYFIFNISQTQKFCLVSRSLDSRILGFGFLARVLG